jgi:hypothetical protein
MKRSSKDMAWEVTHVGSTLSVTGSSDTEGIEVFNATSLTEVAAQ